MIATGVEKLTCCQPDVVSFSNVAVASSWPSLLHRLPTWVPVLAADLKKRMPVTVPAISERNFTPSSIEFVSAMGGGSCGVAKSKIVFRGVTAPEASDGGLVPASFVAATLNV